jgi:class 3 adenylate cyclase
MAVIGWPRELRSGLRWLNERRSLRPAIKAWRELLPGDPDFGDPLSTTGSDPARVLARQAWTSNDGRWSALAELGLAVLQVADWAGEDFRASRRQEEVAILFTDLVDFSTWALKAGDQESLKALRSIDAVVSSVVEDHDGEVVKRMGDGTMAVFPGAGRALKAAETAIKAADGVQIDGYKPKLRVGLHYGTPQPIGADYIGVDVNVAARLCEAATGNEVLVSETVREHLDKDARKDLQRRARKGLHGVPRGLALYSLDKNGARPKSQRGKSNGGRSNGKRSNGKS